MIKISALPRGPVALPPQTAQRLGELAAKLGVPVQVTLDPEEVEEVEAELGSAIPFEVLALLAVEGRSPRRLVALTAGLRDLYDDDTCGLDFPHIAFAVHGETPDGDDEWTSCAAFARTSDRSAARIVFWHVHKPEGDGLPYSLARYLEHQHEFRGPGRGAPIELTLVSRPAASERYATHAKFGRGRVLERAEGKAKVEFADGVRTLAERFLVFV